MSPKSASQLLEEVRPILGAVPRASESFVCPRCLGPLDPEYEQCYPCLLLFDDAPKSLYFNSITVTTAARPSPWYARLAAYKTTAPRELIPVLASVTWKFVHENGANIESALGGPPDYVVPVPSTRGIPFDRQPLRRVASLVQPWRDIVVPAAWHAQAKDARRQEYQPDLFVVDSLGVSGQRVIVLEDTWVSGAHVVSLAGAMLKAGATAVLMLSIARVVNSAFWTDDHPYRLAMRERYDETHWPRQAPF